MKPWIKWGRWGLAGAAALFLGTAHAAVGVVKSFSPSFTPPNVPATLTITLSNTGSTAATGAAITDTLPNGLVIAGTPNLTNGCGGAATATAGGTTVSLTGGSIPAAVGATAGSCNITVSVVSSAASSYVNVLSVGALSATQGGGTVTSPQAAQATLTVNSYSAITGSKSFGPINGAYGNGVYPMTITLNNANAIPLTGVAFTDTLPGMIKVASTPNATTTCGSGSVTAAAGSGAVSLSGGTIPASGSCTVKFDYTVVAGTSGYGSGGNAVNTIAAGGVTSAEGVINTAAIVGSMGFAWGTTIVKSIGAANDTLASGSGSTLTWTINNYNASTLNTATFTDTLPAGLTPGALVAGSNTCGGTVTVSGQTVTLTGGGPLAGAAGYTIPSCKFSVAVTGANSTGSTFSATNAQANYSGISFVDAVLGAVTPYINTLAVTVTPPTTVTVSKAFGATIIPQTGSTTLTITLGNVTGTDATITSFKDDLATMGVANGFVVGYSPAPSTTCQGGTTVTAPAGQTVITASGGVIPAGGSCTITVPIYLKENGLSYGGATNTIPAGNLVTSAGNNQASATARLDGTQALRIESGFNKAAIVSGAQTATLTFTLTQSAGVAAMSNINFAKALPQSPYAMTMVAGTATTTCAGGTATISGTTLSMTGGSLPAATATTGNTCTVTVQVTAPAGSSGLDVIAIATGDATALVASANGAPATTVPSISYNNPQGRLTALNSRIDLSKDFSPVTVALGGTSLLRIPILNNNADAIALTGVSITDNLPTGMVIAPTPNAQFTNDTGSTGCTMPAGSSITATPGASVLTLTGASVAAGSKCILSVMVRATYAGNIINSIPANALTTTEGLKSPLPVSATITSTGNADLYVTKTRTSAAVVAGNSVTYSVVFGNNGDDPVAGAAITDALPANATSMDWACAGSGATCPSGANGSGAINHVANLPKGATLTYTVTVQVPAGATGSLDNTATITVPGTVTDSNGSNNSQTVSDPITGAPATLTVTKTDNSATYTPGGAAVYVIVVGNTGPGNATGVSVVDNLPTGVTLSGPVTCAVAGTANCGTVTGIAGGTSAGATGASISAGAGNTLTFSVPVTFASSMTGSVVNNVTATPATGSGASASDTDTPVLKADLAVTKTAAPNGTYVPGQSLNYTITVSNNGLSDLTGVNVTDSIPSSVNVVSWSCSASGTGADCDSAAAGTGATGATNSIALPNVNLPKGTAIAISVVGTASVSSTAAIVNTVTATPPAGVTCTTAPCAKTATVTNTNAGTPVLNIAKSATPTTFAVSATGSYAITVSNASTATSATTGAYIVSDTLPTGITAVLPIPASGWGTGWDCSASTATVVSCTNSAALIPGASAPVITVPVSIGASAASPSVNTARVSGGGDTTCPATGTTAAHCQASVSTAVNAPGLTVKKTLQGNLVVGVPTSYLITVTNSGQAPTPVAGSISDTIPTGLAIGTLPAGCTAAGQVLTCTIPAGLATGSAVSYTIPVTPDATVVNTSVSNTATASGAGDPTCPAGTNCKDTATGTVTAPQLNLVKTVSPTTLVVGQAGNYTITVTNTGTAATTAVATVSDAILAGLTMGTLPAGCTASGQTVSCTIATGLAATSGTTSFVIPVTATASLLGQSVTNTASVTGGGDPGCTTAPVAARCTGSVTAPVSAPQMTIKKTASTGWAVGVPASYTLEVTNTGSADSFGTITVTDIIPGSLTLGTLPTGCTAAGHQVTCTSSAVLAQGAKISFVIPVTPTAASAPSVSNTATVQGGGDPVCPTAANCTSTVVTPVSAPQLQITETANGPWTIGMSGAAYTITVTNVGPATTTGLVTVNATLPAGLTPGWSGTTTLNGWSCTANGQDIACTATPNLANGGTSTFTFPVNVLAAAVPTVTTPSAVGGGGDPFNGGTTPAAGDTCTALDAAQPGHCATVTLPIPLSGAVSTVKTLDAGTKTPLVAGQAVTYVITATNSGGTAIANYVLNEVVPANATFTSIDGATTACSAGAAAGTLCPVTIASVPAGGSASVRITFTLAKTLPSGFNQMVNAITVPAACAGATCDAPPTPPSCTGSSCAPAASCTAGDPLCVSTPVAATGGGLTPVPTMSEWMLMAMALMMGLMGWRQVRRVKR